MPRSRARDRVPVQVVYGEGHEEGRIGEGLDLAGDIFCLSLCKAVAHTLHPGACHMQRRWLRQSLEAVGVGEDGSNLPAEAAAPAESNSPEKGSAVRS